MDEFVGEKIINYLSQDEIYELTGRCSKRYFKTSESLYGYMIDRLKNDLSRLTVNYSLLPSLSTSTTKMRIKNLLESNNISSEEIVGLNLFLAEKLQLSPTIYTLDECIEGESRIYHLNELMVPDVKFSRWRKLFVEYFIRGLSSNKDKYEKIRNTFDTSLTRYEIRIYRLHN